MILKLKSFWNILYVFTLFFILSSQFLSAEHIHTPAEKIFDGEFFTEKGINAGGWVAQGFSYNHQNPDDNFNGPVTWADRANEYQLNEVYFHLKKTADASKDTWDYGYALDAMYGTNYRWTTASGLESNLNTDGMYGVSIPQAYFKVARSNFVLKMGHFISPVGFYTVGTNNNFFSILPYTFQYGEPFTHTGALGSYKFSEKLATSIGIVRGWDNFDNFNSNAAVVGAVNYVLDNDDAIGWFGILGKEPNLSGYDEGFTSRYFQSLVYTRPINSATTLVLQSDFGYQSDAVLNSGGDPRSATWYGFNSYLYWTQTDHLQ